MYPIETGLRPRFSPVPNKIFVIDVLLCCMTLCWVRLAPVRSCGMPDPTGLHAQRGLYAPSGRCESVPKNGLC